MRKARFAGLSVVAYAVVTLALVAAGRASSSPTVEATPAPAPQKPDFSAMKYLLGTWTCTLKSSRRPATSTFTTTNSIDPSGFWIVGQDHNSGTSWFPYEANGSDRMTYDSDSKRWIDIYYDDLGNYGLSTSPGLHDNTIVWTDGYFTPSGNIVSESPSTETWLSPTKRTMHSTFTEKSGRVNTLDTVCVK